MNPQDGYISYIVNPKSGATGTKLMVGEFRQYLLGRGFEVRLVYTKSLGHARELAAESAAKTDCALVVAGGGDGTVREIAHGLVGSGKPLLILPCGTENLLASELGFDERSQTIIRAFEDGFIRPLDLGKANGQYFTSISGYGFDGSVVKRVSELRQNGHIHHLDYFWPIFRTFWAYDFPPMRVEVDGELINDGPALVFVGNISRYAVGLQILSRADYGDGLLDVCIYKCSNQARLIQQSIATVFKRHAKSDTVVYRQGRYICISSDRPIATELDGDPGPSLPVEISVMPQAVRLMVPRNAKPAGMRTRLIRMLG
jgi:diacylglycerol kinase (ATP)